LFKGSSDVETMRLVFEGAIPTPSSQVADYPPELERIVMRALEKDPERRYPTARALQRDLEAFARDNKLQLSPTALGEWMERTFGRKPELWRTLPAAVAVSGPTATRPPPGARPASPRWRRRSSRTRRWRRRPSRTSPCRSPSRGPRAAWACARRRW